MAIIKVQVTINKLLDETEIEIRCREKDADIQRILAQLSLYQKKIKGKCNEKDVYVLPEEVLYFESVEKKTYAYTEEDVIQINICLYELTENNLYNGYVRISKTTVLNVFKVTKVVRLLNGNLDIVLTNSEHLIVSRRFAKEFNQFIGKIKY